jgi:hypothetical protein
VNNEYIACGSETNDVFVYHKVIAELIACSCSHGTCILWYVNCAEIFMSPSNFKQPLTVAGNLKNCSEHLTWMMLMMILVLGGFS